MHKGSLWLFGRAHNEGNIQPPRAHSGVKGLYYAVIGQGYTAIHRVVLKCYGGLGTKGEYGVAVNGVKGVAYALGPSFSVASCGVGSVDAVALYAISPPR